MNATIPFSILEMLIAHQTPVIPSPIAVNPIAIGIRRLLNVMLMMAGGIVRPCPIEQSLHRYFQHHEQQLSNRRCGEKTPSWPHKQPFRV